MRYLDNGKTTSSSLCSSIPLLGGETWGNVTDSVTKRSCNVEWETHALVPRESVVIHRVPVLASSTFPSHLAFVVLILHAYDG
jgi:hypothetical protein